ncbi:hypothetical protein CB1_000992003 [Camelus ferus]|nr:hypothetical protein CB1_000992003 [Camelus ferus]
MVSNWFANARRRLKNTVRQPDLSWALRIKLYNKYVQGNAERLSVSSDDSCSEDGENPPRNHMNEGGYNNPVHHPVIKSESSVIKAGVRPESRANEDYVSPPKYKSSLLNRYLNDSLRHVMVTDAAIMGKTRQRNHSGSFSSNEFEEELVSPSSSETEGNFVYRTDDQLLDGYPVLNAALSEAKWAAARSLVSVRSALCSAPTAGGLGAVASPVIRRCFSALALDLHANRLVCCSQYLILMARGALQIQSRTRTHFIFLHIDVVLVDSGVLNTLENGSNKGDSAANRRGPNKDDTYWREINAAMALTNLAQGKDQLQGTTSCIIQKSSHIAEVKTVKVPLAQQF